MQFHVENMTCGHCAATITKAIHAVDPAATVKADPPTHRVEISTTLPREVIEKTLGEAGYPARAV
ncbi:copper chaperone [Pusillimonas sp. TS35]|uniref:heavy-metal-associated domain-containing protein n=1 Tax=Paracandidimonas lactea TaxID=2895524 RepID=UPI00136F5876|nr:heavy-metal-associated domain-containing protein [Paracandidimonas lactea]MYN13073.1 copper chaperone [Pusillimonas sp. TS35]